LRLAQIITALSGACGTTLNAPSSETQNQEIRMEKQLSTIGYWLGLICTVLALIFPTFVAFWDQSTLFGC
jgi:hypothetical protein